MLWNIGEACIELTQGNITDQQVDAIVNAANAHLSGGGGVDGAIHRRGGPTIMEETRRLYPEGCPTGSAVISSPGNLSAKYVIHAVGPRWRDGNKGEAEQLAGAYRRSLELAAEHDCESIAFPALSTGAYRYPMADASRSLSLRGSYPVAYHARAVVFEHLGRYREAYADIAAALRMSPGNPIYVEYLARLREQLARRVQRLTLIRMSRKTQTTR